MLLFSCTKNYALEIDVPEDFYSFKKNFYYDSVPLSIYTQYFIYKKCEENELGYTFVLAVIKQESQFDTQEINHNKGGSKDYGLM